MPIGDLPPQSRTDSLSSQISSGYPAYFSTEDEILRCVVGVLRNLFPSATILLGGTHPTVFARQMIAEGLADFIVKGEGEHAIVDLTVAIASGEGFEHVSGLVWQEGSILRENEVKRISYLDSLPLPARDRLDLAVLLSIGVMHGETRLDVLATTILTSRGCPAKCSFCSIHPVWGHRYRALSAERTLEEITELYCSYGIRHLLVEDDNFTFDLERAKAILTTIAAKFPDLSWSA